MPSVSAKQARLMSAIAHGWQPPMKRAPSLAVAREFHAADKQAGKFMHADGGKVRGMRRLLDILIQKYADTTTAFNHGPYRELLGEHNWNPHVTPSDADLLEYMARVFPSETGVPSTAIQGLFDKYSLELNKPVTTYRGLRLKDMPVEGSTIQQNFPQSTTLERGIARHFAYREPTPYPTMMSVENPTASKLLPNPFSGESELVLPPGKAGALQVLSTSDPKQFKQVRDIVTGELLPKFNDQTWSMATKRVPEEKAKGGQIDAPMWGTTPPGLTEPSRSEDFLHLVAHAADRATATVTETDPHRILTRIAAGLASQAAGLSPSGRAEFGRMPGIVNETLSVPAGVADIGTGLADLGGALSDRVGPRVNTPSGYAANTLGAVRNALNALQKKYGDFAPGWSRRAEQHADDLHKAVHSAMDLPPARGLTENLSEAGGMMLGQIPIGGARQGVQGTKGVLRLLRDSPVEWLGPTIRPSLANYGAGTLFGGLAGAAGDPDATPPSMPPEKGPMKEQFQ